jgi:quercetin dioxygenase-like cupin family protein
MSLHHVSSAEIINVRPLGAQISDAVSSALIKTDHLELMRIVLHADKTVPEHAVAGEVTIQVIEGALELHAGGKVQRMQPGDFVYLVGGTPHALHALQDCSVLMTILLHSTR